MKCLKCGAYVYSSDKFCRSCGTTLTSDTCQYGDNIANSSYDSSSCHTKQYDYSNEYSQKNKDSDTAYTKSYNYEDKYQIDYSKFEYAMPNDSGGEDKYVKAYIGQNYNQIKKMKFSLPGLIFGPLYLLYRKVWGYAIAILIISLAATALLSESTAEIVNLLINIFIACKFKEIYIKQAEEKTEHIQQQNLDKTTQELLNICKKKGGVSFKGLITIAVLFLVGGFILVELLINNEIENKPIEAPTVSMTYTVPDGFTRVYQENDYAHYRFVTADNNTCNIVVNTIHTGSSYTEAGTYLNNVYRSTASDIYYPIQDITLNNRTWQTKKTETNRVETGYATLEGEYIYSITTHHYKRNNVEPIECASKYTEFLNTVKIQ